MSLPRLLKQRLFWKIMLIFWLTTIATIIANIYITKQIAFNEFKTQHLREKMQALAKDAVGIYENDGRQALRSWYQELATKEGIRVILLGQNDTPLVKLPTNIRYFKHQDFNDHQESYEHTHHNDRPRLNDHILKLADQHIISSNGAQYTLRILPSPYLRSKFNPEALHGYRLLASFFIIALGSLWVAHSIAKPVSILRNASEKIANGELSTRVMPDIGKRSDELGKLALAFDLMTDKIYKLLNSKKQLFADISHEIRTPLTRQSLAIELLKSDPNNKNLIEKIEAQNIEIEHLISQLLTLLRVDSDNAFQPVFADLNRLIAQTADEAALELKAKHLTLELRISISQQTMLDESLVKRAIENILSNAIKYSPEHSAITINAFENKENVVIQVCDQGPGVSQEELQYLMQPFYRTDKSRSSKTGGYGLGLAIAANIVEKHRGTITLNNLSPHGLQVEIVLPHVQV